MKITSLSTKIDEKSFNMLLVMTAEIPLKVTDQSLTEDEKALHLGREMMKALDQWKAENT